MLWNLQVCHCAHNRPSPSWHIKPVHMLPFYLFKIYFYVILCSWATSGLEGSYIIVIMIERLCVCVSVGTRACFWDMYMHNITWFVCCVPHSLFPKVIQSGRVAVAMWKAGWGGLTDLSHRGVVGARLITLPSNDRSSSVSKAARWVRQWLDCLLVALSMPWSMLGSPQNDMAALCPFQKHFVCMQNIHSITVNIWNG